MAFPAQPVHEGPVEAAWASLVAQVRATRPSADIDRLRRALDFGAAAHEGQTRSSGEPYIVHPLHVAEIVAKLGMDEDSVVAAMLHDVFEDTEATPEQVTKLFGADVAALVQGVTKLQLHVQSDASPQQRRAAETTRAAESLRKMLLAMAQDIRVMVIKLADRLHNMQTLGALSMEKQTRIAQETLMVFAPLAARLGIWEIKWQLEDLAFKTLHPDEYDRIKDLVSTSRASREDEIALAKESLKRRLAERGLADAEISGRPKHLYSIFNKMAKNALTIDEVYDLVALRVLVDTETECYLVLGLVHELWLPIPNQINDYIASPKPNGYRSLHTKVIGPNNQPLEVQIRTHEMHELAEYGVAAHWSYKEGKAKNLAETQFATLRKQLFDWSSDHRTSSDFLRSVSTDLFSEQVFAFTPKGDVIDLPQGSTPVDFAFRVHSSLGLSLVGSKVNGVMKPLNTPLKNGDVVELVTRNNAVPSLDWLTFVASSHTKSKLRAYFRKRDRETTVARGREALEKELRSLGLDPRIYLGDEMMAQIVAKVKDSENAADVFNRVGSGLTSVRAVVDKIKELIKEPAEAAQLKARTRIAEPTLITTGIDNVMLKRARCCQPVPGEEVVGYVSRGRGIVIHQKVCQNALALLDSEPERITPVRWEPDGHLYEVTINIRSTNRQGLLADISNCFSESKTNVVSAQINTTRHNTADNEFTVEVRDIKHLRDVMARLGQFSDIFSVLRVAAKGGRG